MKVKTRDLEDWVKNLALKYKVVHVKSRTRTTGKLPEDRIILWYYPSKFKVTVGNETRYEGGSTVTAVNEFNKALTEHGVR